MPPQDLNFNEDELEAPEWMDLDFFSKVLKHCEKNPLDLKVKSFSLSPATVKGDHYASVMFRASVDYVLNKSLKTKSLIIKTMPEAESHKKELLKETHIFETEIGMYTEVLPRFEKILKSLGDETILSAPCIYHSLVPKKVIIFEDLVTMGYTVLRDRQLTFEEATCAYTKLGKWHAISYKLLQEEPSYFDSYRYGIFTMEEWKNNPGFLFGIKYFPEYLKTIPHLAKYSKYFENCHEEIKNKAMDSFDCFQKNRKENFLYVLCHGDFHMKNIMLKFREGQEKQLEDLMLLDFQMSYVGPMHNDLVYSFFMMLGEDLRPEKMDEVVYLYHQTFTETLKKLQFKGKIPSLVELREQLFQDKYFELFMMCTFLPIWLKFRSGEMDVDNYMQNEEYQKSIYHSPLYIEELEKLLPRYLHRGYFENLN